MSDASNIEGTLDVVSAEEIAGWAWDSGQPEAVIQVDIYDGENKVATLVAGDFRQDLADANTGNGKHGFDYATPDSLKDGKSHTIQAKVTGTNIELSGSPKTLKVP